MNPTKTSTTMRTIFLSQLVAFAVTCTAQSTLLPQRVADLNPNGASNPWDLTVAGSGADQLIFECNNGLPAGPQRQLHIARYDPVTGAVDMLSSTVGVLQLITAGGDHVYYSHLETPLVDWIGAGLVTQVRWTKLSTMATGAIPTAQVRGVYGGQGRIMGDKVIVSGMHTDANQRPFVVDPATNSSTLLGLVGTVSFSTGTCEFTTHAGKVYFPARSSAGTEFHVTDGTTQGTRLLKDIMPFAGNSNPMDMYSVADRLYFSAMDSASDREPWYTDGTGPSTRILKRIDPSGTSGSDPKDFIALGSKVLFTATTGVHGREVWVTDGTAAGTMMVKDLKPGAASSDPDQLVLFNGKVWFVANDGLTMNRNLYATDGTAAGIVRMGSAPKGSSLGDLVPCSRRLFYVTRTTGTSRLWSIDGTKTVREVKPANSPNPDPIGRTRMVAMKDRLYFNADFDGTGAELWRVQ